MNVFDQLQRQDTRNETRIFRSEIAIIVVCALLGTVYFMIS